MKQTVKKLLFMLGIMCLTIFGKETSTTVLADNLDEIENYTIYAEPDWEDGSVYLKYDITWKVLDSDTDGPLEWVKIGIPNSNVEEIEGYSSNIFIWNPPASSIPDYRWHESVSIYAGLV